MTRNRLYLLTGLIIAAGYGWLAYAWDHALHSSFTPCLFKNATGVACPSCGTTRSVMAVAKGHITEAFLINPIGLLMASLMVVLPIWLVYDVITKKDTLYRGYLKFESIVRIKWVAILLAILIILNWAWNIQKEL
ncbi:DUF2752 domain-containing protein [Flavobacterium sp. DGU11]|uniref:DUF2752 domain-containing protein n=1 Tax=Flavobacterium arundinis TaxID=3139143 RepID=A0ABU9I051_9FLAO